MSNPTPLAWKPVYGNAGLATADSVLTSAEARSAYWKLNDNGQRCTLELRQVTSPFSHPVVTLHLPTADAARKLAQSIETNGAAALITHLGVFNV